MQRVLPPQRPVLAWALALSLMLHGVVLFATKRDPVPLPTPPLTARLVMPATASPDSTPPTPPAQPPPPELPPARKTPTPGIPRLAARTPSPSWSAAEKQEMERFLGSLGPQPASSPKPSLAQRSLAMARQFGHELARQDLADTVTLELRPDAPPVERFSLEMYVDSLIKRLNQSAAYVRRDPRSHGVRRAAVQFRIGPDGHLKSFDVLNAGDQTAEIAFIRAVVERAAPFAAFPPDINRSASALAMTICIQPSGNGGGGSGFSRAESGRGC